MAKSLFVNNTRTDKQALAEWEELLDSLRRTTVAKTFASQKERAEYIQWIEKPGNQEVWMAEMFPNYYSSKPAKFQRASTKRLMGKTRYRQARRWARGLSKSTRRMMEVLYKMFVEKYRVNCLLISKTEENAARLLDPYRANLEANQRLISVYGNQVRQGKWGAYEFVTRSGNAFRAVGAEQNPRGARLEELRVTVIILDDVDDDEVCRNTDRLDNRWDWIERAVIPTIDVSGNYLIFFDNNPIDEDCLVNRFAKLVEDNEIMPMELEDGRSSWPEKNSLEDIAMIKRSMSDAAYQTEYRCNPVRLGRVFSQITWGKVPPVSRFKFIVNYSDPATSNRDKPTLKSKAPNSCKSTVSLGYHDGKFYVLNARVDHMNNNEFVEGIYELNDRYHTSAAVYNFIENNTLQDPFFEQVLRPAIHRVAKENTRAVLSINGDDRKKPDKFFRIEATLQPLHKNGQLIFNLAEKENPHMKRLESQFLSVSPNSRTMDGPDAVEGGVWLIQNKLSLAGSLQDTIRTVPRPINQKRL